MKKLLFIMIIMLCAFISKAQNAIITTDGNYTSVVGKGKVLTPINKTYTDVEKGIVYPIYIMMEGKNKGKLFIIKISRKTGKEYKSFLKLVK